MLVIVAVAIIIVMKKQNRDPDKGKYNFNLFYLNKYNNYSNSAEMSESYNNLINYWKYNCVFKKIIRKIFKNKKNIK